MRWSAAGLTAATLVVAAVGLGVPAPAQAATCGSAHGVTVVVDFHQLGGGVQTFCDTTSPGSRTADAQLRDAGHSLTYVQRQPGFICRIDAKPADDPCVNTPPADAYWSLWWSDGKSGTWTYSGQGSASLKVPSGGYVAMSWQGQDAKALPGLSPKPHAVKPSSGPSTHPSSSPHPSTGPGQAPASSSSSASSSADPSTSAHPTSHGHAKQQLHSSKASRGPGKASQGPDRTQAGGPTDQVDTSADDSGDAGGSGGLPGWVAPVAVLVLFLGAGAIALVRRKSSGGA